jgi:isocitrate dehydrogenase kinase/phosphatase
MGLDSSEQHLPQSGARVILAAFENYHRQFKAISRRAKSRFENLDWHGAQEDALERLELYPQIISRCVADLLDSLGEAAKEKLIWVQIKASYSGLIAGREDFELAETFFNSVTRRIFTTVGVDPNIEFLDSDFEPPPLPTAYPIYQAYPGQQASPELIVKILEDYPFISGYEDMRRDAALAAGAIDSHLRTRWHSPQLDSIELVRPVFYRSTGAYLLGRIRRGSRVSPLLLALVNSGQGIVVDAVLLKDHQISIAFSFARSYFHIEVERPFELIHFMSSVMPWKRVAELYISIGYNKHGKTELYRDLRRHMAQTDDRFVPARGDKGMVMAVFTLPSFDVVFKIIKDKFGDPKTTTRQEVMAQYQLVFKHDRVGRLVDTQEFEHLQFDRSRFSDELFAELLTEAAGSVKVEGEHVVIKHLYTERRLTPLNLYLQEADEASATGAVVDYGQAVKDLAAANIFPGDILLKNFGVTRHGRVVFYDYDELCLLTICKFRRFPQPRDFADEFAAEPWFYVGKNDIFPEEFGTFLGLKGRLRQAFLQAHQDLLGVEFWREMQARLNAGEVIPVFPYDPSCRLNNGS